jgi:hypothetical protein
MNATATTGANPFELLAKVREKIVIEKGHDVREWGRIPAFKRSLIEISFNFIDGTCRQFGSCSQDIVPEWARWKEHYDPAKRDDQRQNDAAMNNRDAHAAVEDLPGMTLSANARLDTSLVKGHVKLDGNIWATLESLGFRWVDAFAQWKLPTGPDAGAEKVVLDQIAVFRDWARPQISDLLRELENLEHKAQYPRNERSQRKNANRMGDIRAKLQEFKDEVNRLQVKLPPRKGWFRVYFAHENSGLFNELCLIDWALKRMFRSKELGSKFRSDRAEMKKDIKGLFDRSWGKVVVWNNPSTRTNSDSDDISRHPKIAVQLMNYPKGDREPAKLVIKEGFFQVG